jgi:ADP-ribose pyrophosphatase YjhB (NUDIX family)
VAHDDPSTQRTKVIRGDRIGKLGEIRAGCEAALYNGDRSKILLTRRTDNGQWCLPSGALEPGESFSEACQREVRQETGLDTVPTGVIGIYSSPDWLLEYPDGNRVQAASVLFEVKVLAGTPGANDDAAELGYFSRAECEGLDVLEMHVERIHDAFDFTDGQAPVLR